MYIHYAQYSTNIYTCQEVQKNIFEKTNDHEKRCARELQVHPPVLTAKSPVYCAAADRRLMIRKLHKHEEKQHDPRGICLNRRGCAVFLAIWLKSYYNIFNS